MRDYGIAPLVWNGVEGCEHDFTVQAPPRRNRKEGDGGGKQETVRGSTFDLLGTNFCSKCSAWRGQLGLEPTFQLYVQHIREVFREVWRVLKPTGSLYINLGDTYASGNRNWRESTPRPRDGWKSVKARGTLPEMPDQSIQDKCLIGIPERIMLGFMDDGWILRNKIVWHKPNHMPSSVKDRYSSSWEAVYFFSKTDETQYWTNQKTARLVDKQPPGTQGVEGEDWEWKEKPDHGGPRLKSAVYFERDGQKWKRVKRSLWVGHDCWFDLDAVRAPLVFDSHASGNKERKLPPAHLKTGHRGTSIPWSPFKQENDEDFVKGGHSLNKKGHSGYYDLEGNLLVNPAGKNPGDVIEAGAETRTLGAITGERGAAKVPGGKGWVGHPEGGMAKIVRDNDPRWLPPGGKTPTDFWTVNTQPFPDSHFAVFPEKLVERPIRASCPTEVCVKCGKARERITEKSAAGNVRDNPAIPKEHMPIPAQNHRENFQEGVIHSTVGWTDCGCNAGFRPGIMLDPFAGSGTVAKVARDLSRSSISVEVKSEYVAMIKKRVQFGESVDGGFEWIYEVVI